jgi:hypothetical protein
MEIMQKSLRSVKKKAGVYEYLRTSAEEAEKLVDAGDYIYVTKVQWRSAQKFYDGTKPSEVASYTSCTGTLVNYYDENGDKHQRSLENINFSKRINISFPKSGKVAICSSTVSTVRRSNKYAIKPATIKKRERATRRSEKQPVKID